MSAERQTLNIHSASAVSTSELSFWKRYHGFMHAHVFIKVNPQALQTPEFLLGR